MTNTHRQLRQGFHVGARRGSADYAADAFYPLGEVGVGVVDGGDCLAEGGFVDFGDAPSLVFEFGDVSGVVGDALFALVVDGVEGGLFDQGLPGVAQPAPQVLGADHQQRGVDVLGQRQVLQGRFIIFLGHRGEDGRFGGVHHPVLQGGENLRAGDGGGGGPQPAHRFYVQVGFGDPDFDSVQVGGGVDGPGGGHHGPEPEFPEGVSFQLHVAEQVQEAFAYFPVQGGEHMVAVVEQIGQVQHPEIGDEGFQNPGQHHRHVHRPDLGSFHQLAFASQLAAGEHIHRDLPLRTLLNQLLKPHRSHIRETARSPRMTNTHRQLRQIIHRGGRGRGCGGGFLGGRGGRGGGGLGGGGRGRSRGSFAAIAPAGDCQQRQGENKDAEFTHFGFASSVLVVRLQ